MPEFHCQACQFTTNRKSTYNDHLTSKKHLKRLSDDSISVLSNITDISTENTSISNELTNKVHELEMRLSEATLNFKTQEYEFKLQISELQNQLKMKDMELQFLKTQTNIANNVVQSVPTVSNFKKVSILDKLNKRNAMTIEDFKPYLMNPDYNPYIISIDGKLFPKSIYRDDYNQYIYCDAICKTLLKIPINERPIYCSDVRRRQFYIKTDNNVWIKDDSLIEKLLLDLTLVAFRSIYDSVARLLNDKNRDNYAEKIYKVNSADHGAIRKLQSLFSIISLDCPEAKAQQVNKLRIKLSETANNNSVYKSDSYKPKLTKQQSESETENESDYDDELSKSKQKQPINNSYNEESDNENSGNESNYE